MALDTLTGIYKADCCWVQLADTGGDRLPLVASLGFTEYMKREMNLLDRNHRFSHEIIGMGHNVVIPSLNRDGKYDIPIFRKSGFRSLLAVPIMTYRIHGILGMAFRSRMKFSDDFTRLFDVIAKLLGMSLHKSMMNERVLQKTNSEPVSSGEARAAEDTADVSNTEDFPEKDIQTEAATTGTEKKRDSEFHDHDRSMRLFSESHK
ncbi:MAG TPA: GAF domain-containing protein [Dehalococcoidia bacterium]|nr:GAF domain-containing protein [Dehalococcoidia bacterium]